MNHQLCDGAVFLTPPKHKTDLICTEVLNVYIFMEESFDIGV